MRSSKMRIATVMLVGLVVAFLVRQVSMTSAASQDETGSPMIAFITRDWDTRQLTLSLSDPQGTSLTSLITTEYIINPVWSPDGTQLAFSAKVGSRYALLVVGTDGSNPRILGEHKSFSTPIVPSWSPDGTQILYAVRLGANAYQYGIYKANVDGTGEEELKFEDLPDLMNDTWVAWSPDGAKIAVHTIADIEYHGRIYILNADGTGAQLLPVTAEDGDTYDRLAWSPDSAQVVLYRFPGGADPKEWVAVANADGSGHQAIVTSPPVTIASASWSPDGSQIVFIANEPITDAQGDLWIVDADGSNLHKLGIANDVAAGFGTSWGNIPADLTPPATPISIEDLVAG
jgi:TolB protein